MSLCCLLGIHRPSLTAIVRRPGGYGTLCETCARPLHRQEHGRWQATEPLEAPPLRHRA